MPLLVVFLDGVGLGPNDPATNPLARTPTPTFHRLLGGPLTLRGAVNRPGVLLVPADATLGVPGLPQSATGQTALLTGHNAPAIAGRHVTAYPTEDLRDLLARESIFARAQASGADVALANAYSPEYFAAIEARRLRMAAVTYAAHSAGVRLRGLDDLRAGAAVFHDLTNGRLRQWGHDVPEVTPRQSGRNLARIGRAHDLAFFEFFLTDLAAHGRTGLSADAVVAMVDELLAGVLDGAGAVDDAAPDSGSAPEGEEGTLTVLVTSDHGNLEDERSTAHTSNPVPVLAIGPGRQAFRDVRSLLDLAPAMVRLALDGAGAPPSRGDA